MQLTYNVFYGIASLPTTLSDLQIHCSHYKPFWVQFG